MSESSTKRSISKRNLLVRMGVGALVVGLVLLAIGWSQASHSVERMGEVALVLGVLWLAISRWSSNEPMQEAKLRYMRHVLPAMLGYMVAIGILGWLRNGHSIPVWEAGLAALLPVLPIAWVLVSMWRLIRDSDELERRVSLESMYVTCGVTALVTFAAGMFQLMDLLKLHNALFFVLPWMFLVYGVVQWFVRRKYGMQGMC